MAKSPKDPSVEIFVGCDDGHDSLKLAIRKLTIENGVVVATEDSQLSMPSKVQHGSRAISLADGEGSSGIYSADGAKYTVTDAMSGSDTIDTRNINYATSAVNRVLVYDALLRAGLGGHEIHLITGLPISDYYKNQDSNDANTDLIEKKRANILTGNIVPLVPASREGSVKLPVITEHLVGCEGLSAIYDMAIRDDGSDDPEFFKLLEMGHVGVIDVGGKTIDMAAAYLERGRPQIEMPRTGSIDFGMLRFQGTIRSQLTMTQGIEHFSPRALARIMTEKKMMISGEDVDVSSDVQVALSKVLPELFERIRSKWGSAVDFSRIVTVGGGAYLLASEIKTGLYKQADTRPQPEFANARGMLKLILRKYLMSLANAANTAA